MLNNKEIVELREALENAQNPLFFFDNDADGLCSFIILQRSLGRGKGVPIKTYPKLTEQYLRKVNEFNPDVVFILDKPNVSLGFVQGLEERGLSCYWIDHHNMQIDEEVKTKTQYYNTFPSAEPVTYVSQKIFNKQENDFFAMIGCIGDVYMPDFAKGFEKKYPELFNSNLNAFDALHMTEIGKFSKMLNFGLMNSTTNVMKLIRYLETINSPYDLLEENYQTREFHKKYNELNFNLIKLVKRANEKVKKNSKILFFSYSSETSISSMLSNQLYFENKDKLIIVAYKKPDRINLSIRGENALDFTNEIIESIEGSTGGGHVEATGAMIPATKYEELKNIIKKYEF